MLAFVAVCAGLALVLKRDLIWLPITLGAFVALGSCTLLTALYVRATRLDRGLSMVLAQPWIHWQYTPALWQQWAATELQMNLSKLPGFSWSRDRSKYFKVFCQLFPALFVCSWLVLTVGMEERVFVSFGLSLLVTVALIGLAKSTRSDSQRRYRKLVASIPETYIGSEGIYSGGEFTPWSLSGSYLVEAVTQPHTPAHINFVFQTNRVETRRVLIPPGHDADLELLQRNLHAAMPKAVIRVLTAIQ